MAKKDSIGEPLTVNVSFSADAKKFLQQEISDMKGSADIGGEQKSFSMGNNIVGHVEGKHHSGLFGKWEVNGLSGEVEGQKWTFPKKCEVKEVTEEMATRLAVLSADAKDMSKRIEQQYGLKRGSVNAATIEHDGFEYDIIDGKLDNQP